MAEIALAPTPPDQHDAHVHVTLAEREGWDVHVEQDGRTLLVEHVSGWHRVERRCAELQARFAVRVPVHA